MAKDYLGMRVFDRKRDAKQHGVKGQKWGIRRTDAQLAAAASSRGESTTSSKNADGTETSTARYARLKAQARSGGASSMSDTDLKFFNARTEALARIEKMNKSDPSWLSKTSKKVLQTTAERSLQNISDAVAQKYISDPIIENLRKASKKN